MRVLGIETSGMIGGVALVQDGHLVAEMICDIRGSHVEKGAGMITDVLEQSSATIDDLDGVAVSLGPGSFTGLRVGLALAKGICFGKRIPLLGVPTLDCVAESLSCWEGIIIPMRDARRGEIFFCVYRAEACRITRVSDYLALPPEGVADQIKHLKAGGSILVTGDALTRYRDVLRPKLPSKVVWAPEIMWIARPGIVAEIGSRLLEEGRTQDVGSVEPMYIRPSEAERKAMGLVSDGAAQDKTNESG